MKLYELFEKIEAFSSQGKWYDNAVQVYNKNGLNDLFKYISKTKAPKHLK